MDNTDGRLPTIEGDLPYGDPPVASDQVAKDLQDVPIGTLACNDYIELTPGTSVEETIRLWKQGGHHCALVIGEGRVVGIFTERDVLRKLADNFSQHAGEPIDTYMTPDPETLEEHVPVVFGLNRMMVGGYRHIPITKNGQAVGIVSVRDVLKFLNERFPSIFPK
ncbi:MAG: CBS domain-containing protein [Planctomycetota bacterium]|jgi:predicted transcriptional regulator